LLICLTAPKLSVSPISSPDGKAYFREETDRFYIGNDYLEIGFSKTKGSIWSIVDKLSGVDLKKRNNSHEETWALTFYTETKERFLVSNEETVEFTFFAEAVENGCRLRLRWRDIPDARGLYYQIQTDVNVTVLDDSQMSTWRLNITNNGPFSIEKIRFPCIWGVKELGESGDDDVLVVPSKEGRIFPDPFTNLEYWGQNGPSGFLNMQFMAYYDTYSGFYFASYDSGGYFKSFIWDRQAYHPDPAGVYLIHYPVMLPGVAVEIPYDIIVGVFQGDWHDAADVYGRWALEQRWCKEETSGKRPSWLQDCAYCWTIPPLTLVSTPYSEVSEAIRNGCKYFQQPGLANFFGGWENTTRGWPLGDDFPPRGGWPEFDQTVKQLHDLGVRIYLYISAIVVSNNTELWESGVPLNYTQRKEDGQTVSSYFQGNTFTHMCIGTDYWKKKLKEIVLTLVEHKVDLIQLDGFPWCCDGMECYDMTHGHPLGGGGNWITQNWIEALEDIRRCAQAINPEIAFVGEGIAENFLPYLDFKMMRDSYVERNEENAFGYEAESARNGTQVVVPLFNYVYHRYIMSQADVPGFNINFKQYNALAHSRALNWGEIPGTEIYIGETLGMGGDVIYDPITDLAGYDYAKRIASARKTYARDFLVYGKSVKPLPITSPNTTIVYGPWFITVDPIEGWLNFTLVKPAIQHSAWVSDWGGLGFLFTNIAWNDTVSFNVYVDPSQYGLTAQNFVFLVRDGVYHSIGPVSGVFNSTFEVQPREILLLVFVPGTEAKCDLCPSILSLPYSGSSLYVNRSSIDVTLWNNGPIDSGTFNVSVLAHWEQLNTTEVLAKRTVDNLKPGSNLTLQIPFQTVNVGDFRLTVVVDSDNSTAELNEMNNEVSVAVKAEIWGAGDLNSDGTVDIYDAILLANAYNSRPENPNWNANADINGDNIVDIYDAIILANHYNQHFP
jgi:hypothetical protein